MSRPQLWKTSSRTGCATSATGWCRSATSCARGCPRPPLEVRGRLRRHLLRDGCWFVAEDRDRVAATSRILEHLKDRQELPFWSGEDFCEPRSGTSGPSSTAVPGLVSPPLAGRPVRAAAARRPLRLHSFCLDNGVPWETFKFATCSAWPSPSTITTAAAAAPASGALRPRVDPCPASTREHAAAADPERRCSSNRWAPPSRVASVRRATTSCSRWLGRAEPAPGALPGRRPW